MAKTITDQSLTDVKRRVWARPMVPHLLTLQCAARCDGGMMRYTGRSHTQGTGPLVNKHECDKCGALEELADDFYPRIQYRDQDGRIVDAPTGNVDA